MELTYKEDMPDMWESPIDAIVIGQVKWEEFLLDVIIYLCEEMRSSALRLDLLEHIKLYNKKTK